jgi:hypothetical protein
MVTDIDKSKTKEELCAAALKRGLGRLALWWIENFVVHGPGDVEGEPVRHGMETSRFIAACYAAKPNGRRAHLSGVFMRPKGSDKSGIAARLSLYEAFGPARFDGWAKKGDTYTFQGKTFYYREGEAKGKHVKNPKIMLMATTEKQVMEIYDVILFNCEQGPLAERQSVGMKPNNAQIELPGGGWIYPAASSVKGKDGGKTTFVVFDETHMFNEPRLKAMFETSTRNMPKRQSIGEPWFLETTTMFGPGEDSVAEQSYNLAKKAIAGNTDIQILFDHTYSNLEALDDREEVLNALREAFGEAARPEDGGWIDVEDYYKAMTNSRDPRAQQPHRYFFNAVTKQNSNSWLHAAQLAAITYPREETNMETGKTVLHEIRPVRKGDKIALGFDGSFNDDSTALMGCRIEDNFVFPIHVQELPDNEVEAKNWEVDPEAVNGAVNQAFVDYDVVAFFADPPLWETYVNLWDVKHGPKLLVDGPHNSKISYRTNQHVQMATAVGRMYIAICQFRVKVSNDIAYQRHLLNATKWDKGSNKYVIGKAPGSSDRKVDMAVAGVLAHEAAAMYRYQYSKRKQFTKPAYQQLPSRIR